MIHCCVVQEKTDLVNRISSQMKAWPECSMLTVAQRYYIINEPLICKEHLIAFSFLMCEPDYVQQNKQQVFHHLKNAQDFT